MIMRSLESSHNMVRLRRRRSKPSVASIVTFITLAVYNFQRERLDASYRRQFESHNFQPYFGRSSWLILAEAAPTNGDVPESELPRPINYYELLDLESPNIHRRPKTHTLHNRKKRSAYRSRITNNQIKKAYRKQAQLYHPDKLAARRLKQEKRNSTSGNVTVDIVNDPLANMTIEEATNRFARIAEAYQVLSDPAQRHEYDWELLDMEDEYEEERLLFLEQQKANKYASGSQDSSRWYSEYDLSPLYERIRNGASSFNAWKDNLDPWAVFEDFFFKESAFADDPLHNNDQFYGHQRYHASQSRQTHTPRVSEQTIHRGFDPVYGAEVYTVLRREDYLHGERDKNGKYFYQILGQDFISGSQVDPYTGFTIREYYSAVTEPYLVEEGYSNKDDYRANNDNNEHSRARSSSQNHRASIHKLDQGESITPNRSHSENQWVSLNGRYEAVLLSTCELQILRHDTRDEGSTSTLVWSTETYIPHSRAHGCHLTLNSLGQLILSVDYGSGLGSTSTGNAVLWSSPMPQMVPHLFSGNESVSFQYFASLDNDGVIAVYRVQTSDSYNPNQKKRDESNTATNCDTDEQSCSENMEKGKKMPKVVKRLSLMYNRLSKASIEQKKTKAALAWDHLRHRVRKFFTSRPFVAGSHQSNDFENEQNLQNNNAECVYSTSAVGCLSSGRKVIHLSRTFVTSVKNSVKSIDSKFDQFLSYLTETADDYESNFIDEEDEDILDTLMRVTNAAGAKGIRAAQIGLKRGRRVAGKVVGKMNEVRKQSVKWGERMSENEDFDTFF